MIKLLKSLVVVLVKSLIIVLVVGLVLIEVLLFITTDGHIWDPGAVGRAVTSVEDRDITAFSIRQGIGLNSIISSDIYFEKRFFSWSLFPSDYLSLAELDPDVNVAINKNNIYLYIYNRTHINHDGVKKLLDSDKVIHVKNFAGFDNAYIYSAGSTVPGVSSIYDAKRMKEKYLKDTRNYRLKKINIDFSKIFEYREP